jgi:hypothetical protein
MFAAGQRRFKGRREIVETDSIDSVCSPAMNGLPSILPEPTVIMKHRYQQLFTYAMPNWRGVRRVSKDVGWAKTPRNRPIYAGRGPE